MIHISTYSLFHPHVVTKAKQWVSQVGGEKVIVVFLKTCFDIAPGKVSELSGSLLINGRDLTLSVVSVNWPSCI